MFSSIHVNHLGFRPDDPLKRALMPLAPGGTGFLGGVQLQLVNVAEFVKYRLNSPENVACVNWVDAPCEDTPLGRFAVCDFSPVSGRGGYQLLHGDRRSYPFLIQRDLWKRCFRLLLEWYRIAACGEAVPGYHELCHLDDCQLAEDGRHVDLVGGWHDAGDLRKWTSTMAIVTWYLAELVEEHRGDVEALGLDPELVWHQLRRGGEYLLKTVDPVTHFVWHSIASDDDNGCNVWTDNVAGNADDRRARTDTPAGTAVAYVQTQAALARVFRERDREFSRRLLASALEVWQAVQPRLAKADGAEGLVPGALALWQSAPRDEFRVQVEKGLEQLLARQVTKSMFGQDLLRGYFLTDGAIDGNAGFAGRGGRNLFTYTDRAALLAQALLAWPEARDAARWRAGLELLLEGCVLPMLKLQPYRALPACVFARPETKLFGRPLAGDLCFRYFPLAAEGNNFWLANAGTALALSARALGQPKWAALGQKQLEWIYGFNPSETCMMTGLGYSQAAVFSFYVGQIPGAIINGYTGGPQDEPVLCLNREVSAMNMEYWSVHTAAVLRALAFLENQPLA